MKHNDLKFLKQSEISNMSDNHCHICLINLNKSPIIIVRDYIKYKNTN